MAKILFHLAGFKLRTNTGTQPWAGFNTSNIKFPTHKTVSGTGSISNLPELSAALVECCRWHMTSGLDEKHKNAIFPEHTAPRNPWLALTWPKEQQHFCVPGEIKFSASVPKHNLCAGIKWPAELFSHFTSWPLKYLKPPRSRAPTVI